MRLRVNLKKSSLSDALLANVSEQGKPIKRLLNAKRSQTPKLRRRSQYEQEVASKGGLAVVQGRAARVPRKQPLALIQLLTGGSYSIYDTFAHNIPRTNITLLSSEACVARSTFHPAPNHPHDGPMGAEEVRGLWLY